jgi:hypothetical protein
MNDEGKISNDQAGDARKMTFFTGREKFVHLDCTDQLAGHFYQLRVIHGVIMRPHPAPLKKPTFSLN